MRVRVVFNTVAVISVHGHYSEGPLFRRSVVPKVRCSEGPLFRRFVVPKVLSVNTTVNLVHIIFCVCVCVRACVRACVRFCGATIIFLL